MGRIVAISLLAITCSTVAAARQALPSERTARASDAASRRGDVSATRIRADVEFLASDLLEGRLPGTRGYDLAALYAATQLQAAGWEPAADDGSYFQQVPLLESTPVSASMTMRLSGAGEPVAIPTPGEALVFPGAERVDLTAPAVFAGYGVVAPEGNHDDYAGLDVNGKIVAVLWGAPARLPAEPRAHYASFDSKLRTAGERGAVGLILLLTESDLPRLPWKAAVEAFGRPALTWTTADGLPGARDRRIQALVLMHPAGATRLFADSGTTFDQAAAAARQGTPGGLPLKSPLTIRSVATHRRLTSPNVVARLRGSDPALADTSLVMTAHLDHNGMLAAGTGDRILNGAYDNAVGSGILLDVARALAGGSRPRRSVVVALVTAEEHGLVGSDYLAKHPPEAAGRIVANVNLDMPLFLTSSRDLIAFGAANSSLEAVVREVASELDYTLSPDPMPEATFFIRSDQYSFVKQGVPAVFLVPGFTARDSTVNGQQLFGQFMAQHYHKATDDLSLPMDRAALERFARANLRVAQRIANDTETPAWKPGNFFGRTFAQ